tara:strand:+ start:474 stop:656 length:183 start_codon:yes stop_codon:yes gene_type:complete
MQRPSGLKQLPNIRTGSGGAQRFGHVGGKERCAWDGRCAKSRIELYILYSTPLGVQLKML